MIVRMSIFRRKDGLDRPAFQRYWQAVHAPIAVRIPSLRRYEQNNVMRQSHFGPAPSPDRAIDGVCKLLFDDASAMQNVLTPEMTRLLKEDEARFIQALRTFVVQPQIHVPPVDGRGTKLISLVTRRADLPASDFEHAWRGRHADRVRDLPGVRGYTQNHVTARTMDRQPASYEQLPVDCIDELWLDDMPASQADELLQRIQRAAAEFAGAMETLVVRVHVPAMPSAHAQGVAT